jgi:hypothetical protein
LLAVVGVAVAGTVTDFLPEVFASVGVLSIEDFAPLETTEQKSSVLLLRFHFMI